MISRRNALVAVLLRMYPRRWREEYGPELADVLLSSELTPGVVLNVLWNGLWQRGRAAWEATTRRFTRPAAAARVQPHAGLLRLPRLWRRACIAWLVMEVVSAIVGGVRLRNSSEFGGFKPGMLFVAFISVPYVTVGAFIVFLPAVALARVWGKTWRRFPVLLAGAMLSPVAFAVVVTGSWLIEGMPWSFYDHWANVLRQPRSYGILLPVYTLGGAIVASGLRAPRSGALSPTASPRRQIV